MRRRRRFTNDSFVRIPGAESLMPEEDFVLPMVVGKDAKSKDATSLHRSTNAARSMEAFEFASMMVARSLMLDVAFALDMVVGSVAKLKDAPKAPRPGGNVPSTAVDSVGKEIAQKLRLAALNTALGTVVDVGARRVSATNWQSKADSASSMETKARSAPKKVVKKMPSMVEKRDFVMLMEGENAVLILIAGKQQGDPQISA